jgi:hypothetical protein
MQHRVVSVMSVPFAAFGFIELGFSLTEDIQFLCVIFSPGGAKK